MLPFARMLNYGNIVPAKEEVKSFGASGTYFSVLSSRGNLYLSGTTAESYFGAPATRLSLIETSVDTAWYSYTGSDSIIILKDGKYYQRGAFYTSGTTKTWYDLSTVFDKLFALVPQGVYIKELKQGPCIIVLMSNGELYGIGNNNTGRLGTGNTNIQYNWVLMGTNVKSFEMSSGTTVYLTNNGEVYGTGTNYNGTLLGSNRTTFTKIGTGNYTKLITVGSVNIRNILMQNSTDSLWYGTGTDTVSLGGSLANGNTVSRFTPSPANFYRTDNQCSYGNVSTTVLNNSLYVCGWNYYGMTGLGINANSITSAFTLVPNAQGVIKTLSTDSTSYYMNSNKEIYGCGYSRNYELPDKNGQFSTYFKLTLPF